MSVQEQNDRTDDPDGGYMDVCEDDEPQTPQNADGAQGAMFYDLHALETDALYFWRPSADHFLTML